MGIFDLFSSGPGTTAANKAYRATTGGLTSGFSSASGYLTNAQKQAAQAFSQGQGQAVNALTDQQRQAIAAAQSGQSQAIGAAQQGVTPWQQLFAQYQPGAETYWGALGIGSPEQIDAARARFTASPGYQYQLDQGLESTDRRAAARGNITGATPDELAYAENLANQDYGNWLTRLGVAIPGQQTAAGGIERGSSRVANLFSHGGDEVADLYSNLGSNLSNVYQNTAGRFGDLYGKTGTALADLIYKTKTGIGQAGAQKAQDIFGAKTGAAQNSLNALFALGNMALGGYGMMPSTSTPTSTAGAYDTSSNPYNLPWLS